MKSAPTIPPDLFWESRTAESLGISRTVIRKLRKEHLTPEVDWHLIENTVVLTAGGVGKLTAVLHPRSLTLASGDRPATAKGGAEAVPPGPPAKRKFMVTKKPLHRIDSPQRKILVCAECGDDAKDIAPVDLFRLRAQLKLGAERPVRVRDNENFMPGMVLEAVSIGHGMWQYLGRLPRRLGRW